MNDIMNGFRCAGPWFDGKLPDDFATIKLSMCLFNCKYHHNLFWFWALTLETQRDDLCCFLLDGISGITLLPITAPTRRDGAFSAQRSTPVAADWCYHVERLTWAAEHVKHDSNEICDLPAHALPARRTCQCSDCAVKRQQSKLLMCQWL